MDSSVQDFKGTHSKTNSKLGAIRDVFFFYFILERWREMVQCYLQIAGFPPLGFYLATATLLLLISLGSMARAWLAGFPFSPAVFFPAVHHCVYVMLQSQSSFGLIVVCGCGCDCCCTFLLQFGNWLAPLLSPP